MNILKTDNDNTVTKLSEMRKHSNYSLVKLPILNLENIAFEINIKYRQLLDNPEGPTARPH